MLGLVILLVGSAIAIPQYRCRMHPMARLHRAVRDQRELADLRAAFAAYLTERDYLRGSRRLQLIESGADPSLAAEGMPAWASRLMLYDRVDDVQLIADFDEAGQLIETSFRCD